MKKDFNRMTEDELIATVAAAVATHWTVGEGADAWTRRYSAGRTDDAFGRLVGVSGETVRQARNVWLKFHKLRKLDLPWSHFYAASNWDDGEDWLRAAEANNWSVRTMREERARIQAAFDLPEPDAEAKAESDVDAELTAEIASDQPVESPDLQGEVKALRKSLIKFRERFRSHLALMADTLATFEHDLRADLEPT